LIQDNPNNVRHKVSCLEFASTDKTKILFLSLFAVFLIAYGVAFYHKDGDLDVFLLGAKRLISHEVITVREPNHFTYPPFFALLMSPLALLSFPIANILWYLITWSCLMACILMIKDMIFKLDGFDSVPVPKQNWIIAGGVLVSAKYVLSVFENQQFDLLVFFFCLSGLYFIFKNKELAGSGLLAAGISIKCTPLLFLCYFVLKRKWRVVLFTSLYVGVFSFLPDILFFNHRFSYFFDWFSKIVLYHPLLARMAAPGFDGILLAPGTGVNYLNQSLQVLIYRMFSKDATQCVINIAQLDDHTVALIKLMIFGIVAGIPLVILRRNVFDRSEGYDIYVLMETAAIFILMVLFSPMSSKPHFNTLLFGNTLLVALFFTGKHRAFLGPILVPIFVFQFISRDLIGYRYADYFYQCGITTVSSLLTYAGLIWSHRSG